MTIYVFLGPTLPADQARAELPSAVFLPPVSQGDLYRVALRGPRAIGIVDGYFHRVPAIWHKEVLWAMSRGIHIYGSASMGALRAAELAPFGMVGVGAIFEAFRDGTNEDDDEVAVAHGPAESGYRAVNEAMVNIRPTLAKAVRLGVLREASGAQLTSIAKRAHYQLRSWAGILKQGEDEGVPADEIARLREWLPKNRVDQKREDAVAMLRAMRSELTPETGPKQVTYRMEHTCFWDDLVQSAGGASGDEQDAIAGGGAAMITSDAVLDELRLEGVAYLEARDAALRRGLALRVAENVAHDTDQATIDQHAKAFYDERGLASTTDLERWLDENQLGTAQFDDLIREEAKLAHVLSNTPTWAKRHLPHHLRTAGRYAQLYARAREKRERLERAGLWGAQPSDVGVSREELLAWHFARVGRLVPTEPRQHAKSFDYNSEDQFVHVILREYCYQRLLASTSTSTG